MEKTTLTPEMILKGKNVSTLDEIENLNLWGSNLSDISIIKNLTHLKTAGLSANHIENLESFSNCHELRELFLRNNLISDFHQLDHLVNLKNLRILWLTDNPIEKTENYRINVISKLPQLTKLDEKDITEEERSLAHSSSNGHRSPPPTTSTATQTQKRVLQSIAVLLPELYPENLDLLKDHIESLLARSSK